MSQPPQLISILDARLAEIDRRLGAIQTGLVADEPELAAPTEPGEVASSPDSGAEVPPSSELAAVPPASDAGSAPPQAAELIAKLRELVGAHARLVESMRELVAASELAIAHVEAPAPTPSAPAIVRELSLSAGPLNSTEALRGFERTLSGIPEVRGVEVRGYEGGDRAIVDVHLIDPTS